MDQQRKVAAVILPEKAGRPDKPVMLTSCRVTALSEKNVMKSMEDVRLCGFSPGHFLRGRDPVELVEEQIRGGVDVIQLREKDATKREKLELGLRLRAVTSEKGVLFIVNDDVDLALILDADGVHLGQDDIPAAYARPFMRDKIIGVSTHSLEQVKNALASGADYLGFGPVFDTSTKPDAEPQVGLSLLSQMKEICPIPFLAIGGIDHTNIHLLRQGGCHRAAVISDILLAPDIEERCRFLRSKLE
jgi:thiamine-phosphate pyrophosphorylase